MSSQGKYLNLWHKKLHFKSNKYVILNLGVIIKIVFLNMRNKTYS